MKCAIDILFLRKKTVKSEMIVLNCEIVSTEAEIHCSHFQITSFTIVYYNFIFCTYYFTILKYVINLFQFFQVKYVSFTYEM